VETERKSDNATALISAIARRAQGCIRGYNYFGREKRIAAMQTRFKRSSGGSEGRCLAAPRGSDQEKSNPLVPCENNGLGQGRSQKCIPDVAPFVDLGYHSLLGYPQSPHLVAIKAIGRTLEETPYRWT